MKTQNDEEYLLRCVCPLCVVHILEVVEAVPTLRLATMGQVGKEVVVSGVPEAKYHHKIINLKYAWPATFNTCRYKKQIR